MVGMAGNGATTSMQDFVDRHGLDGIPHTVDTDGSLWAEFGVRGQPAWVFLDRQGRSTVVFGELNGDDLRRRLDALATA
ncbi:MAG: TlpA family protein disulfide reductase [Actinomycetota bacterium]